MLLCDDNLLEYLQGIGVLQRRAGLQPHIERAGDGAVNFLRRVRLSAEHSLIVKQARPALERFPEQRMTTERIVFEHRYAQSVAELLLDPDPVPPRTLHFDAEARVLVLEDVGSGPHLCAALAGERAPLGALRRLGEFLARVHALSARRAAELAPQFENREMQRVHGEQLFTLPFDVNEPARAHVERLLARSDARERIARLRELYYETREALLHADVQASNLLLQGERLRLLDAEIAHWGDPAFDLGMALAQIHVQLGLRPDEAVLRLAAAALLEGYADAGGQPATLARAPGYAGLEVLRRALGAGGPPWADSPLSARRLWSRGTQLLRAAVL